MPVGLGKLVGQVAVAASAQPGGSGRLVLLVDQSTGDKFLVDIGAVFSVIPFSSSYPPSGPKITTTDASPIPCWGWHQRRLKAGGVWYPWKFLRAKVAFPILGANFLAAFDLLVDVRCRRLVRKNLPAISLEAPAGSSPYSMCGILPAVVAVDSSSSSPAVGSSSAAVDSSSAVAVDSSSPSPAVDSSSVEAVFGSPLTIPSQAQNRAAGHLPPADSPLLDLRQRSYAEVAGGHNSLLDGATHVYIRWGAMGGPFSSSYSGPYRILQRGKKVLLLQLGDRLEWVSADRLKPHAGGAPVEALPP